MCIHHSRNGLRFLLLGSASFLLCASSHAAKSKEGKLSLTPVVTVGSGAGKQWVRVVLANESDGEVLVRKSGRGRSLLSLHTVLYRNGKQLHPGTVDFFLRAPREDELIRLGPGDWVIASAMREFEDLIPPGIYEARAVYHELGTKYGLTPELSEKWFLIEVVDDIPEDTPPMLRGTRKQFRGGFAMDREPLWREAPEFRPKPDRGHPSDEVEVLSPPAAFPYWLSCALAAYAGLATVSIVILSVKLRKAHS